MPTISAVKYDPILTNISVGFPAQGHIADQAAPPVSVRNEDGQFWVFDKTAYNVPNAERRPRSRYKEIDWTLTRDSYHAEEYGLETRIDDRERNNSAAPLDLDETGTENLTENLLNAREKRVANLLTSTSVITQNTTLAGAARWDDASGGDPIGVANTARNTIRMATGYVPNTLLLADAVYRGLANNPKIQDFLADGELLSEGRLATILGVERIIIGSVLTNTSKAGQATVLGDVWGKDALFMYVNPRPAQRRASLAYQLVVQGFKTFRYRDNPHNCDVIRVNEIRAEKIVLAALGYLVKTAVS